MDWAAGWQAITHGDTQAVIADGYLIVYDVTSLWYATAPMVLEQMVLRLGDTSGNYRSVLQAIDALVKHHGCVGAVTGNAVARRGLTRAYERDGYTAVATQLYKEKN